MTTRLASAFWNIGAVVLVACTVTLTAITVRREFWPRRSGEPREFVATQVDDAEWRRLSTSGARIGAVNAKVVFVEFSDFECPFCARFAARFAAIRRQHPTDVALVYRHLPLPAHKQAYPAARAAECADDQGSFESFHDLLFAQADSIGAKPFVTYAAQSGVRDTALFRACSERTEKHDVIERDVQEAGTIRVRATPTVFVNGFRLSLPPDSARLDSIVRSELVKAKGK